MVPRLAVSAHDLDTLDRLRAIMVEAGEIALRYFRQGDQTHARVDWKGDGSPVTEADHAVNAFLASELQALWPGAAWLSEESVDDGARLSAERVIIVDPIDGTRGFANGDCNWCIAVALVEGGRPILAVVHAPANGETFTASCGQGAALNGVRLAVEDAAALRPEMRLSAPVSMTETLRRGGLDLDYRPKIASLALRITNVASGGYDCCFVTQNSHDWDLAAADLVLQEAGGLLASSDGKPLIYNRSSTQHGVLTATARRLQPAFLAAVDRAKAARP